MTRTGIRHILGAWQRLLRQCADRRQRLDVTDAIAAAFPAAVHWLEAYHDAQQKTGIGWPGTVLVAIVNGRQITVHNIDTLADVIAEVIA